MAQRDPYAVLGVSRNATADEIKSAYRKLARQFHPDVNPGNAEAEEKFKELGNAYSILSDPAKREQFDRFGQVSDQPQDPFNQAGGFGDLFDMFFGAAGGSGGGRKPSRAREGEDIRADVSLTLLDVLTGKKMEIEVERASECSVCRGNGTEGGAQPESCTTCNGMGVVAQVRNTFIGQVRTQTACPTCRGEGFLIKNPCKNCRGNGVTMETAVVQIEVPPGVETGATMQIPGQGGDGIRGGRSGDLYVVLHVKDDERYERDGQHLHTVLDISFAQACLGDEISIEGIEDSYKITVPAGSQPGSHVTVRAAGLPPLHGGRRGDLICQFNIEVPTNLSDAEVKLIREFAELRGEKAPKSKGGLLGNLFGKKN